MIRAAFLILLLLAEVVILSTVAGDEEEAMDLIVYVLFGAAPLLAWFTIEPEPSANSAPTASNRGFAWLRFPFLSGGASGVAYFLLVFVLTIGVYVLWLRTLSGHGVWLADDDPIQLVVGALYACVYVLLPVGLCVPVLRWWWGRVLAAVACVCSYAVLRTVFAPGPREPNTLTELGDPWLMISTVLADGSIVHYARDDFAVLAGLAALGVLLHVPRIVRRLSGSAGASTSP